MKNTTLRWLGHSLAVTLASLTVACGEGTGAIVGPTADILPAEELTAAVVDADSYHLPVDVPGCEKLRVPAGNKLSAHVFARGVQVYRWNGASWGFVEPEATLFPNERARGEIGTHYAGPWWESVSGSKVKGEARERCTPDATAIQWLLLGAVASEGPGIFAGTTFIHRVNTTGGLAPATPGSVVGELARVPYTADYLFYKAR